MTSRRTITVRETPGELRAAYLDAGHWTDETLGELLDTGLTANPDLDFRVWSRTDPFESTMGAVADRARRFAAGLAAAGIGPGHTVAMQLHNCSDAAVVFWGTAMVGACIVPIVHFYGPREVDYILEESRPDLFVEGALDQSLLADDALPRPTHTDCDSPALIAYTSGTTAAPKGVIHTHRSIVAEVRQLSSIQPPDPRPLLCGAPVGHAIGMLTGLLLPVQRAQAVHLIDVWDPAAVLDAMMDGDITAGSGSTFFLQSLLDSPDLEAEHLEHMRFVGLGGSAVPEPIADRAIGMGISVARAYGSTEHPSTTGASHDQPQDRRKRTDGRALAGVELRIVDIDGHDVAPGVAGEILSRGPDLCGGYTDPLLTAEFFDDHGWYRTGDVGVLDDGWLTITDRLRDVIIRGGENISAVEVEELLLAMPAVAEVAVVAAPDPRLGEHACAFIRLDPGVTEPTLDDVASHLGDAGLAKQKWPEELRFVTDFPRTAVGKVKKFELRDRLRTT